MNCLATSWMRILGVFQRSAKALEKVRESIEDTKVLALEAIGNYEVNNGKRW